MQVNIIKRSIILKVCYFYFNSLKKNNVCHCTKETMSCFDKSTQHYINRGDFFSAGKLEVEMGEIYENELCIDRV